LNTGIPIESLGIKIEHRDLIRTDYVGRNGSDQQAPARYHFVGAQRPAALAAPTLEVLQLILAPDKRQFAMASCHAVAAMPTSSPEKISKVTILRTLVCRPNRNPQVSPITGGAPNPTAFFAERHSTQWMSGSTST